MTTTASTTIHDDEFGQMTLAPWHGPEGGYALWHRGDVVWRSAGAKADTGMDRDIGILIAQIDWLTECTGEGLEGEDAALLEQIRADHAARNPLPAPPTSEQTDD